MFKVNNEGTRTSLKMGTQLTFTCSKSTIQTVKIAMKYVQA